MSRNHVCSALASSLGHPVFVGVFSAPLMLMLFPLMLLVIPPQSSTTDMHACSAKAKHLNLDRTVKADPSKPQATPLASESLITAFSDGLAVSESNQT